MNWCSHYIWTWPYITHRSDFPNLKKPELRNKFIRDQMQFNQELRKVQVLRLLMKEKVRSSTPFFQLFFFNNVQFLISVNLAQSFRMLHELSEEVNIIPRLC